MFTLDASVWVNADSPAEAGYAQSRAFLDALALSSSTILFLPTLLLVEVAGVISRRRGDAQLGRAMAESILALPFVRWIGLDEPEARRALEVAATCQLRGADAVYAAVAAANSCVLVSLDPDLPQRRARLGLCVAQSLLRLRVQQSAPAIQLALEPCAAPVSSFSHLDFGFDSPFEFRHSGL